MNRVMALIMKELLAALKDKKARYVLIVPPIMQLFIFAFAATLEVKNVAIGIFNQDNGKQSIELLQGFHGSPMFTHIVYLPSMDQIKPFIDNQNGAMVVSIDSQFSRNIEAKKPGNIQLILDGRKSNTAQILAGYATQIIQQFNTTTAHNVGVTFQSSALVPRNWFNPNLHYYWYNVPSLVCVLTMLVGLVVTGMSVAREREMGTFDQLLVSPLQPIEIMLGKAIPAILMALGEGSIIVLVGIFIFQVPFTGNLFLLYLGLLVFVCSIVGVGLFISSLAANQQQANLGTFLFLSPAFTLSGFATPIENMPDWLQYITYVIPLRYMLVIVKGLFLKAMPTEVVLSNVWPMAIIAVFTFTGATWLFRKRIA